MKCFEQPAQHFGLTHCMSMCEIARNAVWSDRVEIFSRSGGLFHCKSSRHLKGLMQLAHKNKKLVEFIADPVEWEWNSNVTCIYCKYMTSLRCIVYSVHLISEIKSVILPPAEEPLQSFLFKKMCGVVHLYNWILHAFFLNASYLNASNFIKLVLIHFWALWLNKKLQTGQICYGITIWSFSECINNQTSV